jgi:nitroreductase
MSGGAKPANATLELLAARKSTRGYEERPVPAEVREAVLEATLRAPTAGNMMLYSVIEVEDQGLKERLAVTCDHQPFIAKAPWVLVFLADYQRWMDYFELSGALSPDFARKNGLAGTARPRESDFLLAASDALIAAQTAAIAAESLGLGSCYIGDIMENYEEHRRLFGLPDFVFPVAMLCLGYPSQKERERPRTGRFDRRHIVFRDSYEPRSAADYEEMFASGRGSSAPFLPGAENYGQQYYLRKFAGAFSAEMRRSVAAALEAWRA